MTSVLSDRDCRVVGVWHPWRALRERSEITVRWERMDGRLGAWCADTNTIRMHPGQGQAQGRVTATHEQIHAERGHRGCQPDAVEVSVRKATARRCITLYSLADAVLFYGTDDLAALADELWVDVETVHTRLTHLHPAERGYLERRLAARDGAA